MRAPRAKLLFFTSKICFFKLNNTFFLNDRLAAMLRSLAFVIFYKIFFWGSKYCSFPLRVLFLVFEGWHLWAGCLEKSGTFVQWGYKAFHCMHTVFVPVFQCSALKRHRPIAPDFINSVISQYNGEYGQWMTTQNVGKKILHALHFKWTLFIKYFSSYIKKCQMGTYYLVECSCLYFDVDAIFTQKGIEKEWS